MRVSDGIGGVLSFSRFPLPDTYEGGICLEVAIETAFLRASSHVYFWSWSIRTFLDDLNRMNDELAGWGHLSGYEGDFELTLVMAKKGELTVTAKLRDNSKYTDEATAVYALDQSYLPEFIREFESLSA